MTEIDTDYRVTAKSGDGTWIVLARYGALESAQKLVSSIRNGTYAIAPESVDMTTLGIKVPDDPERAEWFAVKQEPWKVEREDALVDTAHRAEVAKQRHRELLEEQG